jgi:hypothetical protein
MVQNGPTDSGLKQPKKGGGLLSNTGNDGLARSIFDFGESQKAADSLRSSLVSLWPYPTKKF